MSKKQLWYIYTIIPNKEESSKLCAKNLAKIGALFLHNGFFNSEQIVSSEYMYHHQNKIKTKENPITFVMGLKRENEEIIITTNIV